MLANLHEQPFPIYLEAGAAIGRNRGITTWAQGVVGSNLIAPTNYFQSLTILQIPQIEPLVRLLWVPQLKNRFPQHLGALDHRRLGHPIGAPIRISFFQNSRICSKNAGLARFSDLIFG